MLSSEFLKKSKNLTSKLWCKLVKPLLSNPYKKTSLILCPFLMLETPLKTPQHSIKTFAYQSLSSFHKSYKSWLIKYRNKQELWDRIKIGLLWAGIFLFGGIFLYYINLASTRGYFLKLANWELESTKAKNDIVKLEVIKIKKLNWDKLSAPKNLNLTKNLKTIEIEEFNRE